MFSGIIEHKAKILAIDAGRLSVENTFSDTLQIGQSIAHDWACMTVETFDDDSYTFFAMAESFDKTNFWSKQVWESFNVERCLKIWDRVDGHFVTGHVDTIGAVSVFEQNSDESWRLGIAFDESYSKYVIDKGSITINGTSLTIVAHSSWYLEVCIIPLTLEMTNLWKLKRADRVNLEFDMLWKYILNK